MEVFEPSQKIKNITLINLDHFPPFLGVISLNLPVKTNVAANPPGQQKLLTTRNPSTPLSSELPLWCPERKTSVGKLLTFKRLQQSKMAKKKLSIGFLFGLQPPEFYVKKMGIHVGEAPKMETKRIVSFILNKPYI